MLRCSFFEEKQIYRLIVQRTAYIVYILVAIISPMVLTNFNIGGMISCGMDSTITEHSSHKDKKYNIPHFNDVAHESVTIYYKIPSRRVCSIDTNSLIESDNIEIDDLLLDALSSSFDSIHGDTKGEDASTESNRKVPKHDHQNEPDIKEGNRKHNEEIIDNDDDRELDEESQNKLEMRQEVEEDGVIIKVLSYFSSSIDNVESVEYFANSVDDFIEITDDYSLSNDTDDNDDDVDDKEINIIIIDKYHIESILDEEVDSAPTELTLKQSAKEQNMTVDDPSSNDFMTAESTMQHGTIEENRTIDEPSHSNDVKIRSINSKKTVSFGPINVQEYAVTVGSVGSFPEKVISCPLELSWEHSIEKTYDIIEYEQQSRCKSRMRKRIEGIKRPVPRYEPMVTEVLYEHIADEITTKRKLTDNDLHNVIKNKNIRKLLQIQRNPFTRQKQQQKQQRCVKLSELERRQRISQVQGVSIEHVKKIDRDQRTKFVAHSKSNPSTTTTTSSFKVSRFFKRFYHTKVLV